MLKVVHCFINGCLIYLCCCFLFVSYCFLYSFVLYWCLIVFSIVFCVVCLMVCVAFVMFFIAFNCFLRFVILLFLRLCLCFWLLLCDFLLFLLMVFADVFIVLKLSSMVVYCFLKVSNGCLTVLNCFYWFQKFIMIFEWLWWCPKGLCCFFMSLKVSKDLFHVCLMVFKWFFN